MNGKIKHFLSAAAEVLDAYGLRVAAEQVRGMAQHGAELEEMEEVIGLVRGGQGDDWECAQIALESVLAALEEEIREVREPYRQRLESAAAEVAERVRLLMARGVLAIDGPTLDTRWEADAWGVDADEVRERALELMRGES